MLAGWDTALCREALRDSFDALWRYKLRTSLSVLGVMLGIGAVMTMVAVGAGARAEALEQLGELGLSNVVVRYRSPSLDSLRDNPTFGLVAGDAGRLAALGSLVSHVSPVISRGAFAAGPVSSQQIELLAVTSSFVEILDLSVQRGRNLGALDDERISRVCVIGADLERALFGSASALGESVRVGPTAYTIVGVLARRKSRPQPAGPLSPRQFDQMILVPFSAYSGHADRADPWTRVDEIWVTIREPFDPISAGRVIEHCLAMVRPHGSDFETLVPRELLQQRLRLRQTFDMVVGAVALITLTVGGIGVMNVMLTAVLERTAEIGLRRSVGATRAAVARQFLLEAVLVSAAGGLLGIGLGLIGTWTISRVTGWPVVVSLAATIAGLVIAIGVGLASGFYPARRASSLDPIEALRHE